MAGLEQVEKNHLKRVDKGVKQRGWWSRGGVGDPLLLELELGPGINMFKIIS